jgi:hypothetical protein
MAEGNGLVMNYTKAACLKKLISLHTGGDTLKVSLVTDAYSSISIDGTTAITALTKHTGSGYADFSVTNPVVTQDDSLNNAKFDADDAVFTSLGYSATEVTAAVLWDDTVSDYVLMKWEVTTQPNGANYTLAFSSSGIMTLT